MKSIIEAYMNMRKPKPVEALPIITSGKYDEPDEQVYEHFQADLLTYKDIQVPEHHDAVLKEITSKIHQPTVHDLNTVLRVIGTAPARHQSNLHLKYTKAITQNLSTHSYSPKVWHSRDEIIHGIKHGLSARGAGMWTNRSGEVFHHNPESGLYEPVSWNNSSMIDNMFDDLKNSSGLEKTGEEEFYKHIKNSHATHLHDNPEFFEAIHEYTDDSRHINLDLANGTQLYNHTTNALNHMIKTAPKIPHSFDVFSGISKTPDIWGKTGYGQKSAKFHAPAFMSSSMDFAIGVSFAKQKRDSHENEFTVNDNAHPVADMLHIKVPSHFGGGLFLESHTEHKGENEYLISPGHDFTIHPNPRYVLHDHKVVRVWNAEVHHKEE